jgi:hypothetical protein
MSAHGNVQGGLDPINKILKSKQRIDSERNRGFESGLELGSICKLGRRHKKGRLIVGWRWMWSLIRMREKLGPRMRSYIHNILEWSGIILVRRKHLTCGIYWSNAQRLLLGSIIDSAKGDRTKSDLISSVNRHHLRRSSWRETDRCLNISWRLVTIVCIRNPGSVLGTDVTYTWDRNEPWRGADGINNPSGNMSIGVPQR